MQKGDIVLIPFPFTDLTGNKKRPALILISGSLDVAVSFISTQQHWQEPTDLMLQPNPMNGLKKPSLVRIGKIATIDKALVLGKLGNTNDKEIEELDKKLLQIFNIKNPLGELNNSMFYIIDVPTQMEIVDKLHDC